MQRLPWANEIFGSALLVFGTVPSRDLIAHVESLDGRGRHDPPVIEPYTLLAGDLQEKVLLMVVVEGRYDVGCSDEHGHSRPSDGIGSIGPARIDLTPYFVN